MILAVSMDLQIHFIKQYNSHYCFNGCYFIIGHFHNDFWLNDGILKIILIGLRIAMFNLDNMLERFSIEKNNRRFRICNLAIFIIALSIYLLNNHYFHEINWFFMFYFNDLLAIVVLLSFLNIIYPYKPDNLWLILIVTVLASFVWEYVALFIKPWAIFDYVDVLCYFTSMVIYLILLYFIEGKINSSI